LYYFIIYIWHLFIDDPNIGYVMYTVGTITYYLYKITNNYMREGRGSMTASELSEAESKQLKPDEILKTLESSEKTGLSSTQATKRQQQFGFKSIEEKKTIPLIALLKFF